VGYADEEAVPGVRRTRAWLGQNYCSLYQWCDEEGRACMAAAGTVPSGVLLLGCASMAAARKCPCCDEEDVPVSPGCFDVPVVR